MIWKQGPGLLNFLRGLWEALKEIWAEEKTK